MLRPLAEVLGQWFDVSVIAYPFELSRYDEVVAWLSPRLPDEPYMIVAESFSGPVALRVAMQRNGTLKGVVFVASFAKAPRRVPAMLAGLLRFVPLHLGVFAHLARPFTIGCWISADFMARFRTVMHRVPPRTLAQRLQQVLRVDDSALMPDIPCLFLQAEKDRLVPKAAADPFRNTSDVQTIDGPHFLAQAQPERVGEKVREFVLKQR